LEIGGAIKNPQPAEFQSTPCLRAGCNELAEDVLQTSPEVEELWRSSRQELDAAGPDQV